MVGFRHPQHVQRRPRWFVRIGAPADLREIVGPVVLNVPAGHADQDGSATAAAPIIIGRQHQRQQQRRLPCHMAVYP
jgi:hypothetical protein